VGVWRKRGLLHFERLLVAIFYFHLTRTAGSVRVARLPEFGQKQQMYVSENCLAEQFVEVHRYKDQFQMRTEATRVLDVSSPS
jgi:hypothetical protein